ncbi:hypothetical protein BT96DRAFT_1010707 [Gymnopus androsaceus JB14]|uniref:Uncharacterized protein n=1 Tax=Gymnopus androsaceus JB14 TaxID=1447944 RepID=A0A6A4GA92_9AGAR|nr:hypothetical protein BT96DRAFT_1010707 [Gymnopus androsaceus JB14]
MIHYLSDDPYDFPASLANALNVVKTANAQTSVDAGECPPPKPVHSSREGNEASSNGESLEISQAHNKALDDDTPMADVTCTQSNQPAKSFDANQEAVEDIFDEDIVMSTESAEISDANPEAAENISNEDVIMTEEPRVLRRSKRRASPSAEMPDFKPKPAPQATQPKTSNRRSLTHAKAFIAIGKGTATKSKKNKNSSALSKELVPEPEEPTTRAVAKTEKISPVLMFNHNTERKRYTEDPVDVYSYDGKAVFRFQPALYVRCNCLFIVFIFFTGLVQDAAQNSPESHEPNQSAGRSREV